MKKSNKKIRKDKKLIGVIKKLTLTQRNDLIFFGNMPSNRLTNRDKEILRRLMNTKSAQLKKEGERIWCRIAEEMEIMDEEKEKTKNRLYKTISRYISLIKLDANKPMKSVLLSQYYSENQIEKNANSLLKKSIKKLEKDPNFDNKISLFWLYEIAIDRRKNIRKYDANINKLTRSLDEFYVCQRLRVICEIYNRKKLIPSYKGDDALQDQVELLLQLSEGDHVDFYSNVYQFFKTGNDKEFKKIKEYIQKYQNSLDPIYLREFYQILLNFSIRKFNSGHSDYAEEYFKCIKALTANKLLLENETLDLNRFKNIVSIASHLGKLEWTRDFIEEYSDKLSKTALIEKKPFLSLIEAIVAFYSDALDDCFDYLMDFYNSKSYPKDMHHKISCDKLFLKVYFAQGEKQAINIKLPGVRNYIISQMARSLQRGEFHLNFLNTLEKFNNKEKLEESDMEESKNYAMLDYLWLEKMVKRNGHC